MRDLPQVKAAMQDRIKLQDNSGKALSFIFEKECNISTMNIDSIKVELINWIAQLNDHETIHSLLSLKKKTKPAKIASDSKIFGSGKHLVEFISDDFNAPLDMFNGYQK